MACFERAETFGAVATLTFRLKTGDQFFLPYYSVTRGAMNPSGQIELDYGTGMRVILKGQNLQDLFRDISKHETSMVWESNAADSELADPGEAIIQEIKVVPIPREK